MDADLSLVIGLVLGILAVPSILSAITDGRPPRISMLTILIAFGFLFYALYTKPGGYTLQEIPNVFMQVVGGVI